MFKDSIKEKIGVPSFFIHLRRYFSEARNVKKIITVIVFIIIASLGIRWIITPKILQGICIFDFENTLIKPDNLAPYGYALDAQKRCISMGHNVAIFRSKESVLDIDYHHIMKENFHDVWNGNMLLSDAFQVNNEGKYLGLKAIASIYDKDPWCSVFITDKWANEKYTEPVGTAFSRITVGNGVDYESMTFALEELQKSCKKGEQEIITPTCSDNPPDKDYTCQRQKKWGKCKEAWMENNCCFSCFECNGKGTCQSEKKGNNRYA